MTDRTEWTLISPDGRRTTVSSRRSVYDLKARGYRLVDDAPAAPPSADDAGGTLPGPTVATTDTGHAEPVAPPES